MIDTILWRFKDSAGHPACLTMGDIAIFAVMLLLLLLFCLLMAKRRETCLRIRNYLLIPLVAVGGFAIYAIGYLHGGTANSLTALSLRSFLSTFHMFFLHSDLLEVCEEMHHDKVYMTFFALIHFFAFLISFLVVVQLFGTHFLSWLRLKCTVSSRSYVFFDSDKASLTLARSVLGRKERGRLVVVLDKKGNSSRKRKGHAGELEDTGEEPETRETRLGQLAQAGALLLSREYTEDTTFRKTGIKRLLKKGEARLFLLSGNPSRNLRLAVKLVDEVKSGKDFRAKITLYVRLDDERMGELLGMQTLPENMEIRIVSPARLAALELVSGYPPVNYVRPDPAKAVATRDFSAMILGFGETGSHVLRTLAEHGQFVGAEFHATVVDKDLDSRLGTFKSLYPGIEHYGIEYVCADVNSVAFWEVLRTKPGTFGYVVISLGDFRRNMQLAIDIERFICRLTGKEIDIFVKADGDSVSGCAALAALWPSGHIRAFGAESTIFTEDLIVNEAGWALAKNMHEYYNRKKKTSLLENTPEVPSGSRKGNKRALSRKNHLFRKGVSFHAHSREEDMRQEPETSGGQPLAGGYSGNLSGETLSANASGMSWAQLPEIRKLSNLSAALHLVTKLKLAGLSPEMIRARQDKAGFIEMLGEERLSNLAKGEHLHWNATLFAHGWDTWTVISGRDSGNKDEKRRLHACLVDWEELQRIEKRFGEPYRAYDRIYVENIYDWLQDPAIFEEVAKWFHRKCSGKK